MGEAIYPMDPRVMSIMQIADCNYLRYRLGHDVKYKWMVKYVWTEEYELPETKKEQLQVKVVRALSRWRMAFGLINGRPKYVSASANLYPDKYMKAVLKQVKHVHQPKHEFERVAPMFTTALDYAYMFLGTASRFRTVESKIDLRELESAYMGSACGLTDDTKSEHYLSPGVILKVNSSAKKYEMMETHIGMVLDFMEFGTPFPVNWNITEKPEIFVSDEKQQDDATWTSWQNKLRTFCIPSGPFLIMERLVSRVRQIMEREGPIRIGSTWTRGGMQMLAELLGVTEAEAFMKLICQGDLKNFDQSVLAKFVDAYYSTMLVYEKPGTPDYLMKKRIIKFLTDHIVQRITHLFGPIWGIQTGGVPSGCLNTSHMDSWIMLLYFCLFAAFQIHSAPEEERGILEEAMIQKIRFCAYGDDHLWNHTNNETVKRYFSANAFKLFMRTYLGADVQDQMDELTFCSRAEHGVLTHKGMTHLKYQAVMNDNKGPGQPWCLPFRETKEYVVRAVWGRTAKERKPWDLMLSILGHVYGTYGSNYDAYVTLFMMYSAIMKVYSTTEGVILDKIKATLTDSIPDLRRKGITPEEIMAGFPTWERLQEKNVLDRPYHTVNKEDFEYYATPDLWDDCL